MTLSTGLLWAMLSASGADMATSAVAVKRGAVEANPWFSSMPVLLTEKASVGALQFVALKKLEKTHPIWTRVIAAGATGFYLGLAAHNLDVARRQDRR